jgi:hypothetical protein
MASELRVDTLKDSSGSNSVGMAYVSNGSAKAWVQLLTSTAVAEDSFNISSGTDNGTGDFTTTFSSSMNNDDYAVSATSGFKTTVNDSTFSATKTISTSAVRTRTGTDGGSVNDSQLNHHIVFGDLA